MVVVRASVILTASKVSVRKLLTEALLLVLTSLFAVHSRIVLNAAAEVSGSLTGVVFVLLLQGHFVLSVVSVDVSNVHSIGCEVCNMFCCQHVLAISMGGVCK